MSTEAFDQASDQHQPRPHPAGPKPDYLEQHVASAETRREHLALRREEAAVLRLRQLTDGRLRDSHFGHPVPRRLAFLYDQLAARIDAETVRGATRHHRTNVVVRCVPAVIAMLDWVVLVPYGADILNVDPAAPVSLRGLAAALLALLGSGAAYVVFTQTGSRLRAYRTEMGDVAWRAVEPTAWLLVTAGLVMAVALGILMHVRVMASIGLSPDPTLATYASLIGVLFAVLNVLANLAVIMVHALDGSVMAAELRRAGRLLRRREARIHRAERRAGRS